jgi:hypothetical protein
VTIRTLHDQIRDQLIALEFSSKTVKKELLLFKFQLLHEPIVKNKVTFYITIQNMLSKIIVYPFLVLVRFYQVAISPFTFVDFNQLALLI